MVRANKAFPLRLRSEVRTASWRRKVSAAWMPAGTAAMLAVIAHVSGAGSESIAIHHRA